MFGQQHFRDTITINFERRPDFAKCFAPDLDPRRIVAELEVKTRSKVTPGETLLFLDEIQECPKAIAALRYFHEEMPGLHVIAAGSLLEFAFEAVSVPVGRVEFAWMYPLSFSEFLRAKSREILEQMIPVIKSPENLKWSLSDARFYLCRYSQ